MLKNGYHFSVDLVLSPGWFTGLEDVSFHHIEFEKNTVRLLTYDEITQSYFYAMTADFEIEDIEDLDDQWGDEIGLVEEEENRKKAECGVMCDFWNYCCDLNGLIRLVLNVEKEFSKIKIC